MKTTADRIERALDDALKMTFPASDPVAVFVPAAPAEVQIERRPPLITGCPETSTRAASESGLLSH